MSKMQTYKGILEIKIRARSMKEAETILLEQANLFNRGIPPLLQVSDLQPVEVLKESDS
jgi:hypothetical protein